MRPININKTREREGERERQCALIGPKMEREREREMDAVPAYEVVATLVNKSFYCATHKRMSRGCRTDSRLANSNSNWNSDFDWQP